MTIEDWSPEHDLLNIYQSNSDQLDGDHQLPWLERFLYPNGRSVVSEYTVPKGATRVRVAFFLHDFVPGLPLEGALGRIVLPAISPMPSRLAEIAPYEIVD